MRVEIYMGAAQRPPDSDTNSIYLTAQAPPQMITRVMTCENKSTNFNLATKKMFNPVENMLSRRELPK